VGGGKLEMGDGRHGHVQHECKRVWQMFT